MNTEPASERLPIARIAVKASCPVCAAVKHFQESLLANLHPDKGARHDNHAGGGVLGRAAEFLIAQRGILN